MAELSWLAGTSGFPPVEQALEEPNGLLAVGGDLGPARLLAAYRAGIFPWFEAPQPVLWWAPDPRAVFFPGEVHVSRSLRRLLQRREYELTADQAFEGVIGGCAELSERRTGTWITAAMLEAYTALHDQGLAHSIECWRDGELAGGLYGVALGGVFFGESMFSRAPSASKVALVGLAQQLVRWDFGLIDCQIGNPHLYQMGATDLPREQFGRLLQRLLRQSDRRGGWQLDFRHPTSPNR